MKADYDDGILSFYAFRGRPIGDTIRVSITATDPESQAKIKEIITQINNNGVDVLRQIYIGVEPPETPKSLAGKFLWEHELT